MKRFVICIVLVLFDSYVFAADRNIDVDGNKATDIASGGTNATTAENARTNLGVPATAATLVGDCTVGPCLDGTSDGGNFIKLWAGTGSYWTALQGGAPAANRSWRLPIAAPPSSGHIYLMTMDEYGQMGFRPLVPGTLTYTANASPSAAELLANKYISNYGSTGTIAVTLPGVPYEISRAIVIESAQIVQVTPPSGEAFDLSGTTLTVNQSFAGPATVGSKIVITRQRNAAGSWIWSADVVRGTWAGI